MRREGWYNSSELGSTKYEHITSEINTNYDFQYQDRPKERTNVFDDLANILPFKMVLEWKNGQEKIVDYYIKEDGLKRFLAEATGQE